MPTTIQNDTIAAISTPSGEGAIGVVRLSGAASRDILSKVWTSRHVSVDNLVSHRLYYGIIGRLSTDMSQNSHLDAIDTVLVAWMAAPNSYTGEDVVEVSCHGGSVVTKMILSELLKAGARLAEPGEFTRRAFLNGKMDLAEAEGVADVIHASSERALRLANEQLRGALSKEVDRLKEELKKLLVFVEATIDFPEEDIEMIKTERVEQGVLSISMELKKLIDSYEEGRLYREGLRVAIVGRPNVGKSSLFNRLLGEDRAIVHHRPGTTRDLIEERVLLNGINFLFIDTAGLRDSSDEVEEIGMGRARARVEDADLILLVMDVSAPLTSDDEKLMAHFEGKRLVIILNKDDKKYPAAIKSFETIINKQKAIFISALNGNGFEELKNGLVDVATKGAGHESSGVHVTNIRHKRSLVAASGHLDGAISAVLGDMSAEFVAAHIRPAMDSLGAITGEVTTDEILNDIFSNFCIGK